MTAKQQEQMPDEIYAWLLEDSRLRGQFAVGNNCTRGTKYIRADLCTLTRPSREAQLLAVIKDLDWQLSCVYISSEAQRKHAAIIEESQCQNQKP